MTVNQLKELTNIWEFMTENFAELWINKYGETPDEENSRSWRVALTGLTRAQIETGLKQIVIQCLDYPPVPPKFRGLCLSNDDDEAEVLFQEVTHWAELDQESKSRKALFIVQKLDYTNFRRADLKTAKKMFDGAYHKLLKHLSEGNELPEFVLEIEYEAPPPMPKEQLSSFLGNLINSI
ncbi:hypothetical protein MMG00_12080 [Ignatzschineria rhizosphaerae]|uniref:Uncharacterized protein n=1 Tax=Ignatzschineria rhizosphaerae TaxID=2923279 RepID=A0ABY3WZ75_9GAMM|nr:hypothetical protein [Ignatzschineria rhizosphaerae]UNM95923.1 hypothetical protein MMG00_12080 [Ignatzschineria rhizosphaerae]